MLDESHIAVILIKTIQDIITYFNDVSYFFGDAKE